MAAGTPLTRPALGAALLPMISAMSRSATWQGRSHDRMFSGVAVPGLMKDGRVGVNGMNA
jgi:hypothetical protein